ncbi:MAG: 16S rRNA (guanine(966)-N(2))-methyltransferase RsmD [Chloroflexi bacterium]|nr:16S rRNA (guanine(966)-N(2))-methyltransferase RsmD [Chloroflexota bacterium]
MSHRVIAGTARGHRLKLVPGDSTRPITDRAKEALFSILGSSIIERTFLDLYGGTGAVGIEALSRGASYARFIERNRAAVQTIQENLESTGLKDRAEVLHTDALAYLERAAPRPFEFIYVAPPQYKKLWKKTLLKLEEYPGNMVPDATVIVQIDPAEKEDLPLEHLELYDERRYGKTLLMFFEYVEAAHE